MVQDDEFEPEPPAGVVREVAGVIPPFSQPAVRSIVARKDQRLGIGHGLRGRGRWQRHHVGRRRVHVARRRLGDGQVEQHKALPLLLVLLQLLERHGRRRDRQLDAGLPEAYELCADVMTRNALAADAQEGICAFLDKRAPTWTHS